MTCDEATSFDWPDEKGWALAIPDGTWLPTNKAFDPDVNLWEYRELAHRVTRMVEEVKNVENIIEDGDQEEELDDSSEQGDEE
jgi:hypothetical protein